MIIGGDGGAEVGGAVAVSTSLGGDSVFSFEGVKNDLSEKAIPTYTVRTPPTAVAAEPIATRILESVSKNAP